MSRTSATLAVDQILSVLFDNLLRVDVNDEYSLCAVHKLFYRIINALLRRARKNFYKIKFTIFNRDRGKNFMRRKKQTTRIEENLDFRRRLANMHA